MNMNCTNPRCSFYDGDTVEVCGICCIPKELIDVVLDDEEKGAPYLKLSLELAKEFGY